MTLRLTSPSFEPDGPIPSRHSCEGGDVSPPLAWSDAPAGTKSFALVLEGPDAPDPRAFETTRAQWVVYGLPPDATSLAEGASGDSMPAGARDGLNDWKRPGYCGPCCPAGRHRYFHRLYALDTVLADLEAPDRAKLEAAMQGHVLAEKTLVGTHEKTTSRDVEEAIRHFSSAAAAAILVPLSVFDVAFLPPIQEKLMRDIARIHGHGHDDDAKSRIRKALRSQVVQVDAAIVGAKLVTLIRVPPFAGSALGMAIAFSATRALGELYDRYFAGGCTMSERRMVEIFHAIYKEQFKREYARRRRAWAAMMRDPETRRKMRELRRARRHGTLSADEARRRIDELLGLTG
jgi:Raf kinase inhibitor-like YbhB/YbcL family protein